MSSALMLRGFCCYNGASSLSPTNKKKQLVFMGSPQVAANCYTAAFYRRDRRRKVMPSPVAECANDRGFPHDLILTPGQVGEETFLSNFRSLQPDLCVTAAHGNILPSEFLKIPPLGSKLLIRELPSIFDGSARVKAQLQDDS